MQEQRSLAALRRVAVENGVPLETVLAEIENMIRVRIYSEDPDIRRQWAAIPRAGDVPTPLELMDHLIKRVNERMEDS